MWHIHINPSCDKGVAPHYNFNTLGIISHPSFGELGGGLRFVGGKERFCVHFWLSKWFWEHRWCHPVHWSKGVTPPDCGRVRRNGQGHEQACKVKRLWNKGRAGLSKQRTFLNWLAPRKHPKKGDLYDIWTWPTSINWKLVTTQSIGFSVTNSMICLAQYLL